MIQVMSPLLRYLHLYFLLGASTRIHRHPLHPRADIPRRVKLMCSPSSEEDLVPQRKPGHLPTILRPGISGRAGRFATPAMSNGGTSDLPSFYTAPPTLLQTPVQEHPYELSPELLGVRTPLILTENPLNSHYQPSFPMAQPYTPEPQLHHEQGQWQSNHHPSGQTPQQYAPSSQGYVPHQQTLSPPPQQYASLSQGYVPPHQTLFRLLTISTILYAP
ncbi:hypothetical protein BDR07DRAFT_1100297 [Suillus spraguei]|nr:hypothetical protein BDR07DRAFT_1100297 [Suillus spraguei]